MSYIVLLGIFWNVGLFLQSLISLRLFKRQKSHILEAKDVKVYILIAIRNEDLIHVRECVEYFLVQKRVFKLIFCLTEIESDHERYVPLLQELQKQDARLTYTTFKGNDGYKAEQVNVALKNLQEDQGSAVIGLYDIDSRPDERVFEYVQNAKIQVGQQFTLYDVNLNDLNLFSLAGSLHQSFWSIGFEMFNFFFPKRRLVYTIGHGLFLDTETLKISGLFEEKCIAEDLMYGYKTSIAKRKFQVIPYFEHAKFVQSAREFISQSARWYAGELELIQRFKGWYRKFNGKFSDRLHFYFRIIELLWWPLERFIYIATILGTVAGLLSIKLALLYTGVLILSGFVSATILIRAKGWNQRLIIAPLLVPVWHIVSVAGPLYALIKKMIGSSITWTVTQK